MFRYSDRLLAWENIYRRLQDGVYFLEVDTVNGDKAAGTAFKFTDVLLATAGHNLGQCDIRVSPASDMEASMPAEKLEWRAAAGEADAGLLRLPRDLLSGPKLISQQRLPEIGEQVAAIGFPTQPLRHPTLSLNVGVVESLPVSLQGYRFIQVSFHGGGGLSGAPLIDRGGYVLGTITENVSDQPHDRQPIPRSFAQVTPAEYLYDLWRGGSGGHAVGESSPNR